ncbi:MAG: DUF2341 domain-containing protein [Candidatus Thorarchaeota archaeon]
MKGRIAFLTILTVVLLLPSLGISPNQMGQVSESSNRAHENIDTKTTFTEAAWLTGWQYRKAHFLEAATGAGTGFQVHITVHYGSGTDNGEDVYVNSNCQTDFDDIRFTDDDETTQLDYWRETYTVSDYASFWVRVNDSLDQDVLIYLYYGNVGATTTSNASNVFEFYDGFNRADSSIVGNGWTEDEGPSVGEISISSDTLQIYQYQDYYCHVEQAAPPIANFVFQGKLEHGTYYGSSWTPSIWVYWGQYSWFRIGATSTFYAVGNEGGSPFASTTGSASNYVWYYFRLRLTDTMAYADYSVDGSTWVNVMSRTRSAYWAGAPSLIIVGKGYSSSAGYPNLDVDNNYSSTSSAGTHHADDIFIRKEANTAVTQGDWSNEIEEGEPTWLNGWQYRKMHTMNGVVGAGTSYQIRIKVHYGYGEDSGEDVYLYGRSNPDFSDVRFTDISNGLELNYWIETYVDSDFAIFWVKIPYNLDTDQSFYMYYGNIWATTASDGDSTFIFFDDFNTLDTTNKWTVYDSGYSVSSSILNMYTSGNTAKIYSKPTFGPGIAFHAYAYYRDVRCLGMVETQVSGETEFNGDVATFATEPAQHLDVEDEGVPDFVSVALSESTWQTLSIRWYSALKLEAFIDDSKVSTHTTSVPDGIPEIPIYYYIYSGDASEYLRVDWNFVRKCIENEPTHGDWGLQEFQSQSGLPTGWLDGWDYRKLLKINSGVGVGTDYQIRLRVFYGSGTDSSYNVYCYSHVNPDFSDLRFTASNGTSILDYWIESYVDSNYAWVWVEVSSDLDLDQSICMYYGNHNAQSASNGTATFLLFDDFEDGVVSGWTTDTPMGSVSESSGVMTITIPSGTQADWWSGTTENAPIVYQGAPAGNWIAETRLNSYSVRLNTHAGIMIFQDRNNAFLWGRYYSSSYNDYKCEYILSDLGYRSNTYSTTTLPSILQIDNYGSGRTYRISTNNGVSFATVMSSSAVSPSNIGLFAKNWATNQIDAPFEWIYVRKRATSAPSFNAWSSEQSATLDNWNFYKSHNITGTPGVGAGYQVKIKVNYGSGSDFGENVYCNARCQSDFDDIRFTDDTRLSLLDYWIESVVPGSYAIFWVEIPETLDVDRTIYMYYGNPYVNTTSSGFNTMSRWASYNTGDSESSQSTYTYLGGTTVVAQEMLFMSTSASSYTQYRVFTQSLSNDDRFMRVRFQPHNMGNNMYRFQPGMYVYQTSSLQASTYWAEGLVWSTAGLYLYYTASSGGAVDITQITSAIPTEDHWYDVKFSISGTQCSVSVYNENTSSIVVDTTVVVYNHDSTTLYAAFGQYAGSNPGTVEGWYDDFYVRKYHSPEPGHGLWGKETVNDAAGTDAPITIQSNSDFSSHTSVGDGSSNNPYILSDYYISTSGTCISITNTTAYFVVANSTLLSRTSGSNGIGIDLLNVSNGWIDNDTIEFKATGINIQNCTDVYIANCTIQESIDGIYVGTNSFNTTILYNRIEISSNSSVHLDSASFTNITMNEFADSGIQIMGESEENWQHVVASNKIEGIPILYLWDQTDQKHNVSDYSQVILAKCKNITLTSGRFIDIATGITLAFTNDSLVYDNFVGGSTFYSLFDNQGYNNIWANNTACNGRGVGVYLLGVTGVELVNNTVYGQDVYGIQVENSTTIDATGISVWQNRIGYNTLSNALDNGSINLWDDDISIGNKWADYPGSGVYNIPGTAGSVDRYPGQLTNILPSINSPPNQTIEVTTIGNYITWETDSSYPDYYEIFRDGSLVETGDWFSGTLSIEVDGLGVGDYNYTIFVFDYVGFNASDSVMLTVEDTTPPTIDAPLSITYDYGTIGNSLTWNVTDPYPSNYTVYIDYVNTYTGYHTLVSQSITANVDSLVLGIHNVTLYIEDAFGNDAISTVNVTVRDGTSPLIDSPSDIYYEFGMVNIGITWNPIDLFPSSYEIFRDSSSILSDVWYGGSVSIPVTPLALGTYNFTIVVTDVGSNNVTDQVNVTVESAVAPAITPAVDFWYEVDTSNNFVDWVVWDRHPALYEIYRNNSRLISTTWDGSNISRNIDGLAPGFIYNFTLLLQDQLGNNSTDTVWVRVRDLTAPTITTPSDQSFESGIQEQVVSWLPFDLYPRWYILYKNGSQINSTNWVGGSVQHNVDDLVPGYHNLTLVVFDIDNNNISDTVFVRVYPSFPPVVDHPIDISFEYGTFQQITWTPTDVSPDYYEISINGTIYDLGNWFGGAITFNLTDLYVGEHDIVLEVFDLVGNSASDSVHVTVYDTISPVVIDLQNYIWVQSSPIPSSTFTWYAYDLRAGNYVIYHNGVQVDSGNWENGEAISFSFSTIPSWGSQNISVIVYDQTGNSAMDSVLLIPHELLDFDVPADISFIQNTTISDEVAWVLLAGNPVQYWIYVDYIEAESNTWTGTEYHLDVSNLAVGVHYVSIAVEDSLGFMFGDEVVITVLEETEPTTTTPEPLDLTWVFVAIPISIGVVIVIICVMKRKST